MKTNPKYVLRNWMAQLAIDAAENEDYSVCEELQKLLKAPYDEQLVFESNWYHKRPEWARHRVGCRCCRVRADFHCLKQALISTPTMYMLWSK